MDFGGKGLLGLNISADLQCFLFICIFLNLFCDVNHEHVFFHQMYNVRYI